MSSLCHQDHHDGLGLCPAVTHPCLLKPWPPLQPLRFASCFLLKRKTIPLQVQRSFPPLRLPESLPKFAALCFWKNCFWNAEGWLVAICHPGNWLLPRQHPDRRAGGLFQPFKMTLDLSHACLECPSSCYSMGWEAHGVGPCDSLCPGSKLDKKKLHRI